MNVYTQLICKKSRCVEGFEPSRAGLGNNCTAFIPKYCGSLGWHLPLAISNKGGRDEVQIS